MSVAWGVRLGLWRDARSVEAVVWEEDGTGKRSCERVPTEGRVRDLGLLYKTMSGMPAVDGLTDRTRESGQGQVGVGNPSCRSGNGRVRWSFGVERG